MRRALAAMLATAAALAGCGGGGAGGGGSLTVSAAASLKSALPAYDSSARYSFAGSDELAAQIRAGARPDVYAAANTTLPGQLFARGLVARPVAFATNRLVIAVPAGARKVHSIHDLAKPGLTIAAGSASVPIGSYAREVIGRLPPKEAMAIGANIRSNEPDVAGIVGKVSQRAVDAGFVYVTDVKAAKGKLEAIELPPSLQPKVAYAAAVVSGSKHASDAAAYVKGLLTGKGAAALREAGFEPPPTP